MNQDQKHDREFMDTFMLILGFLIAFTFFIFVLANVISAKQSEIMQDNPVAQQLKAERLMPIATANKAKVMDPNAPAETTVAAPINGQNIYEGACGACHTAGIAGAPKFGDAAAWADRITQGSDILYEHAIQGYQGDAGYMPPKGGRADLSDEEVIAAVDYMVENSQ